MKKLIITRSAPVVILIVAVFIITLSGCFGEKYKIESPKISGAEEVSNSCAQKLGLDEDDKKQLAKVLKDNGSKLNDEFKLDAMMIISESDSVTPDDRDNVQKAYFSCIENSTNIKTPK